MKLLYTKPDARIELLSCADILTGSEENAREGVSLPIICGGQSPSFGQ